jgi:hypothetical protein
MLGEIDSPTATPEQAGDHEFPACFAYEPGAIEGTTRSAGTPSSLSARDGIPRAVLTAKTPANVPSLQWPPRVNAPGSFSDSAEGRRPVLTTLSAVAPVTHPPPDVPHHVEGSYVGDAVGRAPRVRNVRAVHITSLNTQVSTRGPSGGPRAATCHSWLVGSRLNEFRAAAAA